MNTFENDLLFDDAAILESAVGRTYLTANAENLSPDCNCSGYTAADDDEELNPA